MASGKSTLGFAAFASQYLSRQPSSPPHPGTASTSTQGGQPMFYSFTTDGEDSYEIGRRSVWGHARGENGDNIGKGKDTKLNEEDLDDPHLMGFLEDEDEVVESSNGKIGKEEAEDEDPYLRLDEDDQHPTQGLRVPLMQGHQQRTESPSASVSSQPGWLAHLTRTPSPMLLMGGRRGTSTEEDSEEEDGSPPREMLVSPPRHEQIPPPPRTQQTLEISRQQQQPQQHISLSMSTNSLTDSLLPRDGRTRPLDIFSLPDPMHFREFFSSSSPFEWNPSSNYTNQRRRRRHLKYHDPLPLTVFLAFLTLFSVILLLLLIFTHRPASFPSVLLPYSIMLRTVPVLMGTALLTAVVSYGYVWLLSVFVRPVMVATEVGVPLAMFGCAVWSFAGSFVVDEEGATWGETTGLRIFSLLPLIISLVLARRLLYTLPRKIHHTSATLTLSTRILMLNPFLLGLSPLLLVVMLVVSIPFVTMAFRLLLIGYSTGASAGGNGGGTLEWHVRAWANWVIALVLGVWIWTWAVARGILRTTTAGVVGAWYFADQSLPPPPPTYTHTLQAALFRSTGPSLGSVVLAGFILTLMRIVFIFLAVLHRLPGLLLRVTAYVTGTSVSALPFAFPAGVGAGVARGAFGMGGLSTANVGLSLGGMILGYLIPGVRNLTEWVERKVERVSRYALVYVGLTGAPFWEGAGRAGGLVGGSTSRGIESPHRDSVRGPQEQGQGRRGGRRGGRGRPGNMNATAAHATQANLANNHKLFSASEPALSLLTLSPLTLTLPSSLLVYLFVAHTLGAPHEALGAALLGGATTLMVGGFCCGLVGDVADTLFLCYCIDKFGSTNTNDNGQDVNGGGDGLVPVPGKVRREEVQAAFEYGYVPGLGGEDEESVLPGIPGSVHVERGQQQRMGQRTRDQNQGSQQKQSSNKQTSTKTNPKAPKTNTNLDTLRSPLSIAGGAASVVGDVAFGTASRGIAREPINIQRERQGPGQRSPYSLGSSSDDEEVMEHTPVQAQYVQSRRTEDESERREAGRQEEEEDDLDPFVAGSQVDEREGGVTNINSDVVNIARSPPRPGLVGASFGAESSSTGRGTGSAPGGARHGFTAFLDPQRKTQRGERMMTSTQELNVKSRFLMDMGGMRMGGSVTSSESGSSVGEIGEIGDVEGGMNESVVLSGTRGMQGSVGEASGMNEDLVGSTSREGEGEGEESLLGPGSGFFK